jgi:NitT/TauT family transport system substrate-binding protein
MVLGVLLATLLLNLTGCPDRRSTPAGPAEKVLVACPPLPMSSLFIVTLQKDFFAAEGVDVVLQRHDYGKLALRSVLDGKADVAVAGDTPIMFAAMAGEPVRVLAVISTAEKSEAIVARKDRGISTPGDLKGKRVGVTLGTTGEFYLDSLCTTRGVSRKDVNVVDLGPGELAAAMREGRVDAVSVWQPFLAVIRTELGDRGITFLDETIYSEIMCVATHETFVRTRPEAVRRVLRALVKGESFIRDHPEESRRLVADFIHLDRALLDQVWSVYDFRVTLDQSLLVSLEDQTKWALRTGRAGRGMHPNYLDFIHADGLLAVKPSAVRLIR